MSENNQIKAMVTGASGFIGSALVPYLLNRGFEVRAISRQTCPVALQGRTGLDWIQTNSVALPKMTWFKGVDWVFHLAGLAHANAKKASLEQAYTQVNVELSEAVLLKAAQAGVKRFIYFSSVKAIEAEDVYGKSKRLAETRLEVQAKALRIGLCILRPALVYGPRVKGNLALLRALIQKKGFPSLPDAKNARSLIALSDLLRASLMVAQSDKTIDQIYTVTDGIAYSSRQIYEALCELDNKSPGFPFIPVWAFRWGFCLLGRASIFEKIFGSAYYPDLRLAQDTGFTPKYALWDKAAWEEVDKTFVKS